MTSMTRTGPSQGAAMRTTNSSPARIAPSSPRTFWKVANSLGETTVGVGLDAREQLRARALRVAHAHAVAAVHERAVAVLGQLQLVQADGGGQRRRHVVAQRAGELERRIGVVRHR